MYFKHTICARLKHTNSHTQTAYNTIALDTIAEQQTLNDENDSKNNNNNDKINDNDSDKNKQSQNTNKKNTKELQIETPKQNINETTHNATQLALEQIPSLSPKLLGAVSSGIYHCCFGFV